MFCVECGKEGTIFKDGVCINCYVKTHTFSKGPETIDLPICPHCGSYKYKNTWTLDLFGEVLQRIIRGTFKISKELEKLDINTECNETKQGMQCKIFITGRIGNNEVTEEHKLLVRLKNTVCDVCAKKFGGYHEAIIQMRADKRNLSKDELENIIIKVENLVEILRAKGNRTLFIADIGEERGGLDFYISDKNAAQIIAKKIQEEYGGSIKPSSKNIGMKDSRQVYRVTYAIRLPSFQKNDFIEFGYSFYQILSVHGNKIKTIDLSNWDEHIFDMKSMKKVKILGGKELIKEMILVSQTKNEVQIMDSKTYEIEIVKKPKPVNFSGKTIFIAQIKDKLFLYLKKEK